ncbi:hypothetical protein Hte_002644 [Hypoxylon texense]
MQRLLRQPPPRDGDVLGNQNGSQQGRESVLLEKGYDISNIMSTYLDLTILNFLEKFSPNLGNIEVFCQEEHLIKVGDFGMLVYDVVDGAEELKEVRRGVWGLPLVSV